METRRVNSNRIFRGTDMHSCVFSYNITGFVGVLVFVAVLMEIQIPVNIDWVYLMCLVD